MKKPISLLAAPVALVALVLHLSSCSPVPYGNVGQNVPLFKQKGEASFTGTISSTDDANGIGLQAAVAADSSIELITSFYSLGNSGGSSEWKGSGRYFELGAGKFGVINNSNWVYDFVGGIGIGGIKNESGASHLDVNFLKPFIQSSIGLTTKWVEVAFTPRVALPIYTSYKNTLTDPEHYAQAETYFKENKTNFVFEPGLTFRFGYKAVKANFSFCTSSFRVDDEYSDASVNTNYVSIGLAVLITERYKE